MNVRRIPEKTKISLLLLAVELMVLVLLLGTRSFVTKKYSVEASTDEFMWYYLPHGADQQPQPMEKAAYIKDYDVLYVGRPGDKVIYLTFDDCPENGNIPKILDVLEKYDVPAAFFMTEAYVKRHPDVIQRIVDDGCIVGNHTSRHIVVSRLSFDKFKAELAGVEDAYRKATGGEMPKYFRPPQGAFSESSLSYTESLGYTTVFWSFRYTDWDVNNQPPEEKAFQTIMKETHPGEIVLLHSQSKTNVKILERVICAWKEERYAFGSLNDISRPKFEYGGDS